MRLGRKLAEGVAVDREAEGLVAAEAPAPEAEGGGSREALVPEPRESRPADRPVQV